MHSLRDSRSDTLDIIYLYMNFLEIDGIKWSLRDNARYAIFFSLSYNENGCICEDGDVRMLPVDFKLFLSGACMI